MEHNEQPNCAFYVKYWREEIHCSHFKYVTLICKQFGQLLFSIQYLKEELRLKACIQVVYIILNLTELQYLK